VASPDVVSAVRSEFKGIEGQAGAAQATTAQKMRIEKREEFFEPGENAWWTIVLCTIAVGVISGLGAVAIRAMIAAFHNLFFSGNGRSTTTQIFIRRSRHVAPASFSRPRPAPWALPFLVQTFAPEAKGHGVPEVMDAIYHKEGRIRPIVAPIKSVASALSIGGGGSVGREGPIIQVGAAFGSTLGQVIAMPARQRALLIAAGAAGGIDATFNTPIGGIAFAVELMLPSVTSLSLLCVAISSVIATFIGRLFFTALPSFDAPSLSLIERHGSEIWMAPGVIAFGLLLGILAWMLTRGIYWFEDIFDAMPGEAAQKTKVSGRKL
jgi:chloride channel protein, CIC family